jgi:hypothetical protein
MRTSRWLPISHGPSTMTRLVSSIWQKPGLTTVHSLQIWHRAPKICRRFDLSSSPPARLYSDICHTAPAALDLLCRLIVAEYSHILRSEECQQLRARPKNAIEVLSSKSRLGEFLLRVFFVFAVNFFHPREEPIVTGRGERV